MLTENSHNPLQVQCSQCHLIWLHYGGIVYNISFQGVEYVCEYIMMMDRHIMESSVHISLAVCLDTLLWGWKGAVLPECTYPREYYACKHTSLRALYMQVYVEHMQALRMQNYAYGWLPCMFKCKSGRLSSYVYVFLVLPLVLWYLLLGCLEMGWNRGVHGVR